jgi:hypothetical protein
MEFRVSLKNILTLMEILIGRLQEILNIKNVLIQMAYQKIGGQLMTGQSFINFIPDIIQKDR